MSRFLISCGGTGGHLSPGIALAEGLTGRGHQVTLLISRKQVDQRLAQKYPHLTFLSIPGAPLGSSPVVLARFVWQQSVGLLFSLRLVRRERPRAVIGFGGFTSAGIMVAARVCGVPVILHEANHVPGRATRLLGRLARRVYLPPGVGIQNIDAGVIRPAGFPVRNEIRPVPRDQARTANGLEPHRRTVVILGGSQGASALNEWARAQAPCLARQGVQLLCVTGMGKGQSETRENPDENGAPVRAVFLPFSDRMGELLSAADLVVSRAGAGTLAELMRCGTPAILIPFPHAADNHQAANAACFAALGGGSIVAQTELESLAGEVDRLLADDGVRAAMRMRLGAMDEANAVEPMLDDIEALSLSPEKGDRRSGSQSKADFAR